MKRYLSAFIFALLVVICISAMAEDGAGFEIGAPHEWSTDYRDYFKLYTRSGDGFVCNIEDTIYDEQTAEELYGLIAADVARVAEYSEAVPEIYVVDVLLAGKLVQSGARIYCTPEDVRSGGYREYLVEAMLQPDELWKSIGIEGWLFGHEVDDGRLKRHYRYDYDLEMAGLFPAYFLEEFAYPRDIAIARDTAVALTGYIMEKDGMDGVLSADHDDYRQEWLNSIGVDRSYSDAYGALLDGYEFSTDDPNYPLVAFDGKNQTFYIQPMEYEMYTVSEIKRFLGEAQIYVDYLFNEIERDAPGVYEELYNGFYSHPVDVYCLDRAVTSHAMYTNEINLGIAQDYYHEITHVVTVKWMLGTGAPAWAQEGIAEYFSVYRRRMPELGEDMYYTMLYFAEEATAEDFDPGSYERMIIDAAAIMRDKGLLTDDISEYEIACVTDIFALLQFGYIESGLSDTANTTRMYQIYPSVDRLDGNRLANFQSISLTAYLVDNYSLAQMMDYMRGAYSFEEAFGITFEAAAAEWREYLDRTY